MRIDTIRQLWKNSLFIVLTIQIALSIVNVFTSPLPIPPRTSVGIITGLSLLLLAGMTQYRKQIKAWWSHNISVVDICVLCYVLVNGISLVLSDNIYQTTGLRALLCAVIVYFFVRIGSLQRHHEQLLVHSLGAITIGIACFSILQMIFPAFMQAVGNSFFQGSDKYSVIEDFQRGRLAYWGSIILTYPLFLASYIAQKNNIKSRLAQYYFAVGFAILVIVMIMSNFRWTLLCFIFGILYFTHFALWYRWMSKRSIGRLFIGMGILIAIGLLCAKIIFGYNVIERLLIANESRDYVQTVGRVLLFHQAYDAFSSSPVLGIGPGNYSEIIEYTSTLRLINPQLIHWEQEIVQSHNVYLTVLTETGIVGFVLFVTVQLITISQISSMLYKEGKGERQSSSLSVIAVYLSLVMFYLYGLFENIQPHNIVYIFFIIGLVQSWKRPRAA